MAESISINEQFQLAVEPDTAFIKVHFVGEGMTLVDAARNIQQKLADASEHLRQAHPIVSHIDVYDVYAGQKDDGMRFELQTFPRPLIVQGLLISAPPDDPIGLYSIIDDLMKRGALPNNPHRRSYLVDVLDSALLFGIVDHRDAESQAIAECLAMSKQRAQAIASAAGKQLGALLSVSKVIVEPSCTEPFKKDYSHIRRSFPTHFLSPTPHKVILCASLCAEYSLVDL